LLLQNASLYLDEGATPMTERIRDFLRRRRDDGLDDGPCLVVDLDVVRDNYKAFANALGVRLLAVDYIAEVEKIGRAAPGAKVFCRFLFGCAGAEWPLSRKFGC